MDGEPERPPILLHPPVPPSDLIASALHLPLSAITTAHAGRKLRTRGQILAYDPKSSLLLLCAAPTSASPTPIPTLLANIEISLLGQNPSVQTDSNVYSRQPTSFFSDDDPNMKASTRGVCSRERLRLDRGEWVTVVGWLEGHDDRVFRRLQPGSSYAPPISLILEAIHISPSRAPPAIANTGVYRAEMKVWDGTITVDQPQPPIIPVPHTANTSGRRAQSPITIDDDDDDDQTPRVRRKR